MNHEAAVSAASPTSDGQWILSVVPYEKYGGMSRFATYYSKEWSDSRRSPPMCIVNTYGPGERWKMPFYFLISLVKIVYLCATGKVACLHIHMAERLSFWRKAIVIKIGNMFRVPTIVHLHSAEFREFYEALSPPKKKNVVHCLNSTNAVVALGSPWYSYLSKTIGVTSDRLHLIHNGVPDPVGSHRPASPDSEGPRKIAFVGALNERKGLHDLISALSSTPLQDADWICNVAGNGDVDVWQSVAERAGIADKIRFHGWLSAAETTELLASVDIFVLPSYNEGLPLALLEAMAHGLAIVSTPVGAIEDAISEDNGILIPAGAPALLGQALLELLTNQALRVKMGERARSDFLDRFEVSKMNDRIENVIHQCMKGSHTPTVPDADGIATRPTCG